MTQHLEGKELENHIVKVLEDKGYIIYQQNVKIRVDGNEITEFDIIGFDFIIEVKGGTSDPLTLRLTKQRYNHLNLLPNGYKIYYYYHNLPDEEIVKLNEALKSDTAINSLEPIYRAHKIFNEVTIKTQADFTKFLGMVPFDKIKTINKITIEKFHFYATYYGLNYVNDYLNIDENVKLSEKINWLKDNKRIHLDWYYDPSIPTVVSNYPKNIYALGKKGFNPKRTIFLKWHPEKLEYIPINKMMPEVFGVTKLCKCKKVVIFDNLEACSSCYKARKID